MPRVAKEIAAAYLGLRQTLPSTAATTDRLFQRAKGCDSAYLLVCDQGVSSTGPPLSVNRTAATMQGESEQADAHVNFAQRLVQADSAMQSTRWSMAGHGFRPGHLCTLLASAALPDRDRLRPTHQSQETSPAQGAATSH